MVQRHIVRLDPIAGDPHRDPLTVSYLEWRPDAPAAETVVLLHGGGFDSASRLFISLIIRLLIYCLMVGSCLTIDSARIVSCALLVMLMDDLVILLFLF